jgi:hypothetical protein
MPMPQDRPAPVVPPPLPTSIPDVKIGPEFAASFVACQGELARLDLEKNRTVVVEHKGGGSHSYSYATMSYLTSVVVPVLARHGLGWMGLPSRAADGRAVFRYLLIHASGQGITGEFPISHEGGIQQLGSALSYLRRYIFVIMLGLAPEGEDDDGQAAQAAYEAGQAPPSAARRNAVTAAPKARASRKSAPQEVAPDLPGGDPAAQNQDGPVSPGLQKALFAQFRDLGLGAKEQREERLGWVSQLLARRVGSINDLTHAEGRVLAGHLDTALQSEQPRAKLQEIADQVQASAATEEQPA